MELQDSLQCGHHLKKTQLMNLCLESLTSKTKTMYFHEVSKN